MKMSRTGILLLTVFLSVAIGFGQDIKPSVKAAGRDGLKLPIESFSLKDGSLAEMQFFIVKGNKPARASDGTYELMDGSNIVVQNGKVKTWLKPKEEVKIGAGGCNFCLKDGTPTETRSIIIRGGTNTPASDGVYELHDGSRIQVQGGKVKNLVPIDSFEGTKK